MQIDWTSIQVLLLDVDLLFMITLVPIYDYVLRPFTWPIFTPYVNGFMDFVQLVFNGVCVLLS